MFSKHCAGHELLPKHGCNKNSIRAGLLCLGEARVPTGTGPLLLLYQQKIDPEAQGPSPLRSPFPRSPVRARPDPDGFLSLGSRIPRLALHIPGCFVGFHGN